MHISNSKKIIIPGIQARELKPIASLLFPHYLIIPMFLMSILAQLMDNLKGVLSSKDVHQLSSVKSYSKVILKGRSSVLLSVTQSIAKTLGSELETLSVLNISERLNFLRSLQEKILLDKNFGKISSNSRFFSDSSDLSKHRKGLSMQCRSIMITSPIFSPYSITLGIPISQIDICSILDSAKLLWSFLGLEDEEFDFLLRKEALTSYRKYSSHYESIPEPTNNIESVKWLVYFELKSILGFKDFLVFENDSVVLRSEDNLTLLERELSFISRHLPNLPDNFFISDKDLSDVLIRAAVDQRRKEKEKIDNVFKRIGNFNVIEKGKYDMLKKSRLKNISK